MGEAVGDRLAHEQLHLVVVVAEPAGRRRVGGVAGRHDLGLARRALPPRVAEQVERLLRRERVGDVAEVDARDDLLRGEVDEQLPQRLALDLGPQVPDRVDDRRGGEVHHALLRPEPAQLAVGDEAAPEAAHVADDPVEAAADDERLEGVDSGDADLGAAAAREGEAVPLDAVVRVGAQDDVRGRVVRIGVHRVGAVEPARGREADVARLERDDARIPAHSRKNPIFETSIAR